MNPNWPNRFFLAHFLSLSYRKISITLITLEVMRIGLNCPSLGMEGWFLLSKINRPQWWIELSGSSQNYLVKIVLISILLRSRVSVASPLSAKSKFPTQSTLVALVKEFFRFSIISKNSYPTLIWGIVDFLRIGKGRHNPLYHLTTTSLKASPYNYC